MIFTGLNLKEKYELHNYCAFSIGFSDEMYLASVKSKADAEFYKQAKHSEGNKILLTPEYLELKKYEALGKSSKVYYGPNIPSLFMNSDCHDLTKGNVET